MNVQSEEDEDVSPDPGVLDGGVVAKSFERAEDDEDGGPAVVEREGEVYPELVVQRLCGMEAAYDVVNVCDC